MSVPAFIVTNKILDDFGMYLAEEHMPKFMYLIASNYKIEAIKLLRDECLGAYALVEAKYAVEKVQEYYDIALGIERS